MGIHECVCLTVYEPETRADGGKDWKVTSAERLEQEPGGALAYARDGIENYMEVCREQLPQ